MTEALKPRSVQFAKVVGRAWRDSIFKARLLNAPAAALAEVGFEVPRGMTVRIVQNTAHTVNLVLPLRPPEGELAAQDLEKLAAGETPTGVFGTCCMTCDPGVT
jgi:hypothetical protein